MSDMEIMVYHGILVTRKYLNSQKISDAITVFIANFDIFLQHLINVPKSKIFSVILNMLVWNRNSKFPSTVAKRHINNAATTILWQKMLTYNHIFDRINWISSEIKVYAWHFYHEFSNIGAFRWCIFVHHVKSRTKF